MFDKEFKDKLIDLLVKQLEIMDKMLETNENQRQIINEIGKSDGV